MNRRTVESSIVGRTQGNRYFAKVTSPDTLFRMMLQANSPATYTVLGDGCLQTEFSQHFNLMVDLIKGNVWTSQLIKLIDWESGTITLNNEFAIEYRHG